MALRQLLVSAQPPAVIMRTSGRRRQPITKVSPIRSGSEPSFENDGALPVQDLDSDEVTNRFS